ncbi:hypothetical protein ABZT04_02985 [Streptomyces sp. NPDC005492]|uniref:hypothetical protein n=1 Tax=Streptomyces sp. NPDC005492 TaxID=3156883 RepID=UPI0033A1EAB9
MLTFFAAVILTALVAPVFLIGSGINRWRDGKRWLPGLFFSAAASVVVYAFCLFFFVIPADFAKQCGQEADRFEQSAFPLTATCHWAGGRTYSLVPALANPVLYACIAATLVCAVMAVRDRHRKGPTS